MNALHKIYFNSSQYEYLGSGPFSVPQQNRTELFSIYRLHSSTDLSIFISYSRLIVDLLQKKSIPINSVKK